jgi:hypothetical protein
LTHSHPLPPCFPALILPSLHIQVPLIMHNRVIFFCTAKSGWDLRNSASRHQIYWPLQLRQPWPSGMQPHTNFPQPDILSPLYFKMMVLLQFLVSTKILGQVQSFVLGMPSHAHRNCLLVCTSTCIGADCCKGGCASVPTVQQLICVSGGGLPLPTAAAGDSPHLYPHPGQAYDRLHPRQRRHTRP